MSVYLCYDTMTKQYLKDLVFNKGRVVREWANYYVNVSTSYTYPHEIANFPCSVRNDEITEDTYLTIKTLSFDDVSIATLSNNTLDVRARFVKPDKTVITKDLISIDLSSKFSATMIKDKSMNVFCFVVDERVNVGEAKGAMLFQIGVRFKTGVSNTPELAVVFTIG